MKDRKSIYGLLALIIIYVIYFMFYKGSIGNDYKFEDIVDSKGVYQIEIDNSKGIDEDITKDSNIKNISWDENIEFFFCDGLYNYNDESKGNFLNLKLVNYLILKTKEVYRDSKNYFTNNLDNLGEYCISEDGNKIIFWSYDGYTNSRVHMFRYDKELDLLEKTNLKSYILNNIEKTNKIGFRDYGSRVLEKYFEDYVNSKESSIGFGKKDNNIIPFNVYGVSFTGRANMYIPTRQYKLLDNQKNIDYCINGLTPNGNLPVCYADISYSYDFVKNIITEDKICTYYIDDDGVTKSLQSCYVNNWDHKGYEYITGDKGIKLYQNDTKNISIIDVDLKEAGVNFGGVFNKNSKVYGSYEDGYKDINTRFTGKRFRYDLIEESILNKDSIYHFERKIAKEIFGESTSIMVNGETKSVFGIVNGQFFNADNNPTFLSFPVKSQGKILSSYVDNDIPKRTLIITNNENVIIKDDYKKEYLLDKNNREVIVAFKPTVNARPDSKIGRSYIGISGDKKITFFVAKNKSQDDMNTIISNYGIEESNIIMMDGGPSAQFAYYDLWNIGGGIFDFYGEWAVPQYNIIYSK